MDMSGQTKTLLGDFKINENGAQLGELSRWRNWSRWAPPTKSLWSIHEDKRPRRRSIPRPGSNLAA